MKTKITMLISLFVIGIMTAQTPHGELKRWHKITIDFEGPSSSETASTNPFSDYRLDVTFTNGSNTYVVPGFYSGCGNPEDTSCESGNIWKVNFAPDRTGTWNWTASFKTGTDVAVNGGGSSTSFDGDSGSFVVSESDKTGRDFRSADLGRLQYVGEHYLKHSGNSPDNPNGPWFVKAGSDSPENAFNYEDFDATPDFENGLNKIGNKTWEPHQQDYDASDASDYTWANGKGTEMLGVINYISSEGSNAMSFLTWNTGGDGGAVFPHLFTGNLDDYTDSGIYKNVAQWNLVEKDRFDVSKLAQWEKIMEYADKKGVYLHFKTMETENDNHMDSNSLGRERKLYYRELIARFSHHLALNWNLTEETSLPDSLVIDTAEYIRSIDPYDHHIVIHTYPNQKNQRYTPLLGNNSELTGPSLQSNANNVHSDVIEWIEKSADAGKKWVIANDEQGPAGTGIRIDEKDVRYKVLYGTLMAGGAGVEYYYGYTNTDGDINNQNHRLRGDVYKQSGYALDFFNNYLQDYLIEMVSSDGVTSDSGDYVLASEGQVYAVYRPDGGTTNISLPTGDWSVQWYNPRTGGNLTSAEAITSSLVAPDNNDWVALITGEGVDETDTSCDVYEEQGGVVIIEAENRTADLGEWEVKTATLNNAHTGDGYLEFTGNSVINGPANSPIEYEFKINEPGLYELHLRCARETVTINGEVRRDVANDCYVRVDGDYGESPNAGDSHNDDAPLEALQRNTKFFGGNDNSFIWADGGRLDLGGETNKRVAIYDFKAGETYTLTVSGRSQLFKLDRMMFRKITVNESVAEALDNAETFADDCGNGTEENSAPTVVIDTPVNNAVFVIGTDIGFNANASDSDGTIEQVQFFVNGQLLKTERVLPYTATMSGYGIGTYTVTAIATDNEGATAASNAIIVKIEDEGTPGSESIAIPGSFEAEDYTNIVGSIRKEATPGTSGENLGYIKNGDTVEYLVDVEETGAYVLDVYASSKSIGGTVNIYSNNALVGSVNVPANGVWHNYIAYQATVNLSAGQQTLKFAFNDNSSSYLINVDKVVVAKDASVILETAVLSPVNDAYLQGSARYNSNNIRVENGNRVGYLMFDLSDVAGTIETIDLQFTIFSDKGNGNLNVNLGMSSNWTEANLSSANKPNVGVLLGSINTTYNLGNTYKVSLDASEVTGDTLTLVLTATSGNDFDFGSKENAGTAGPKLLINDEAANKGITLTSGATIEIYPNPVVDVINFKGNIDGAVVKVYSLLGALQKEVNLESGQEGVNVSDLAPGVYIVNVTNVTNGQLISEMIKAIKQ